MGRRLLEAALLGGHDCVVHVLNICEVYYDCLRRGSTAQADELLDDLSSIGLITRDDIDASLWKTAEGFKANIRRVSLAHCFAIAMTKRLNAELMTSDHHEFDAIDAQGICPINFIR
jgi:predicted nucleic acid-binding protein